MMKARNRGNWRRRMCVGVIATWALANPISARAQTRDAPLRVGPTFKGPEQVRYLPPDYPAEARKQNIRGPVIVELLIDPGGSVADVKVLRPLPLVSDAACAAARQWNFAATLVDGRGAWVTTTMTVMFPPSPRAPKLDSQRTEVWQFQIDGRTVSIAPSAVSIVDLEVFNGKSSVWAPLRTASEVTGSIRFDQPRPASAGGKRTAQLARLRAILFGVDGRNIEKTFIIFEDGAVEDSARSTVSYLCDDVCRSRIAALRTR